MGLVRDLIVAAFFVFLGLALIHTDGRIERIESELKLCREASTTQDVVRCRR